MTSVVLETEDNVVGQKRGRKKGSKRTTNALHLVIPEDKVSSLNELARIWRTSAEDLVLSAIQSVYAEDLKNLEYLQAKKLQPNFVSEVVQVNDTVSDVVTEEDFMIKIMDVTETETESVDVEEDFDDDSIE